MFSKDTIVKPTHSCDVGQVNCIPEDGSRQTVEIAVIVDSESTILASGCGNANSAANALLCSTGNVWTYNGRSDFTVECRVSTTKC
uniref:C6 domain-containing protein n=1 Tax=Caenorhabditis japonica TaxID=281687 RepID=A0A8R1EQC5_CAEJA